MDIRHRESFFLAADRLPAPLPAWEYHAHSTHSDGRGRVAEVVQKGLELGLSRLIFTEHTEPELVGGPGWFGRYRADVLAVRTALPTAMEVLVGLEAPVIDMHGTLRLDEEMISGAEFILGAVHAFPGYGYADGRLTAEQAVEIEYQCLLALTENPLVDAIAHPGGVCQLYITPFPMDLFEEVVIKAVNNGIAIEINPAYQDPIAPYLTICQRHGAMISPGSNAHQLKQIGDAWRALSAAVATT